MNKKQIAGIGIAVLLIAIYSGIKTYSSNIAEEKVNEAIAKAVNFADIDYNKVSVDLLGNDVKISDIIVSPADTEEKLTIDEIIIHDIDDKAEIPTFLSISCNGIELKMEDFGEEAKNIRELGYTDKIMLNLKVEYAYDEVKKELDFKKISLGADDVGKISFGFRLGNISLEPDEIAGLPFNFEQIIFHEAKLKYEDDSLAERIIKLGAKEQQTNVKDFKKFLIQEVETEIEKEKDDFSKKALNEVKEFIEDPEEFSISASPSKPYPLGRIMRIEDPKDVLRLLNIQIKQ